MFDALINEVSDDTLAKLTLAVTAGAITAVAARKLYKEHKENQLLKKYGAQEEGDDKHQSLRDQMQQGVAQVIDTHTARELADNKNR